MKHTVSFPVRYYECDPYNHVNHANYVRYMGEAAFSASAAVGYADHKLEADDYVWITREHQLEFIQPYKFGDTVRIESWVADVQRVRSRRQYRFYIGDSGQVAANGLTDWVLVRRSTGLPARIPAEMAAAFMRQNGAEDEPVAARSKFPAQPAQPAYVGNIECPVEWRDLDPNGHVNNAAYFSYIENGTLQLCDSLGWPIERMEREGFAIFARRYRLEYLKPAKMGDRLILQTWVADPRRAMATRHYRLLRQSDMEPVVQARCLWVWVDTQTEKPIRIPAHFLEDFASNFSG